MAVNEVARVYAGALLEIGKENKVLQQIEEELGAFKQILREDADFRLYCKTPGISNDSKKILIDKVFQGKFSDVIVNFLKVLVDNGRFTDLDSIHDTFLEMLDVENSRLRVTITGSAKLEDSILANVKSALAKKFNKEIIIEEKVDASILGGVIIRVGDVIIDGSLVKDLNNIRRNLLSSKVRSEAAYED
ncbi:MAG: F0F1 ATP synthase subunit delta [Spirochaetes bacterium]|nr:F0F1 ATP synthase subunit delta [Spirochaetota bacterium]